PPPPPPTLSPYTTLFRSEARRGQRGTPHQLVRGVPGPGAHQPLPSIGGELTMANCTTYLYNDPRLGCALPSGHDGPHVRAHPRRDRKSTRLNSSHVSKSY